jgi:hypothetical protein
MSAIHWRNGLKHRGASMRPAPCLDSASQVDDSRASGPLEELGHQLAADAHLAVHDDLAVQVDLRQPPGHFVHGNQLAAKVGDLVLMGLAHVENINVLAGIDALLQFFDGELGNSVHLSPFLAGFRDGFASGLEFARHNSVCGARANILMAG